jgi:hypothetical protein
VAQVTAPTRRPLTPHTKLRNPVTDFSALPGAASVWDADAVIVKASCRILGYVVGRLFMARIAQKSGKEREKKCCTCEEARLG